MEFILKKCRFQLKYGFEKCVRSSFVIGAEPHDKLLEISGIPSDSICLSALAWLELHSLFYSLTVTSLLTTQK